jgi:L-cysteine:1D-myo-inositol 2-amino-2-deoxy-alpha-D-glucopyranoside ligase
MRLYNSATRQLEDKTWGKDISLYVCGITPYDAAHMGHVFTFVTYDILQRYLEHQGHHIKMVRNITDVDEPIYRRARELGVPYTKLAKEQTMHFQQIMRRLGLNRPFAEPKVSEYIGEMAAAVKQLLTTKNAYQLDGGDIYFDVSTVKDFGKLSGFSEQLQLAFMRIRGGDPGRVDKRQPLDFLLWKAVSDPDDVAAWDSVVGHGRPGWHIECSVMSSLLLGSPIDIHGGGMDLIFPHHEAENAQSVALGHEPFVKQWMHVAPLLYQGEKMSKSLGNLVFASRLMEHHKPNVIRLAILQYHYRIGGEWHNDALTSADSQLAKIGEVLTHATGPDPAPYLARFYEALDNDLDTPEALHSIMQLACETNKQTKTYSNTHASFAMRQMLAVLGIQL